MKLEINLFETMHFIFCKIELTSTRQW